MVSDLIIVSNYSKWQVNEAKVSGYGKWKIIDNVSGT